LDRVAAVLPQIPQMYGFSPLCTCPTKNIFEAKQKKEMYLKELYFNSGVYVNVTTSVVEPEPEP
jgi:hypothetical protein